MKIMFVIVPLFIALVWGYFLFHIISTIVGIVRGKKKRKSKTARIGHTHRSFGFPPSFDSSAHLHQMMHEDAMRAHHQAHNDAVHMHNIAHDMSMHAHDMGMHMHNMF